MRKQDDTTRFGRVMAVLGETFGKDVTESLTEIYWRTLEEFTIEQVEDAAWTIIKSMKFFPKPCELCEEIRVRVIQLEYERTTESYWLNLEREVKRLNH